MSNQDTYTRCTRCFGRGYVVRYPRPGKTVVKNCPSCGGRGEVYTKPAKRRST